MSNVEKVQPTLLICADNVRRHVSAILDRNHYEPVVAANEEELFESLSGGASSVVFLDGEAVANYGTRIYSKIKVACAPCKIILLCALNRRKLIKEAMEMGAYACVIEPYPEWEILTMIRHCLAGTPEKKLARAKKRRRPKSSHKLLKGNLS